MTEYGGAISTTSDSSALSGRHVGDAARTRGERRQVGAAGWARRHRTRLVAGDLLVATACSVLAFVLAPGHDHPIRVILLWAAPVVWVVVLASVQAYNTSLGSDPAEYRVLGRAGVVVAALFGLLFFVSDVRLPRDTVVPLVPMMFLASLGVHWLARRHLYQARLQGRSLRPTVVVGRADSVSSLIREIASAPESGMRIVAACVSGLDSELEESLTATLGVPVFGPPETALAAVDAHRAEVVAVSSHPDLVGAPLRRLGWALAERQVDLVVAPGIVEVAGPRLSLRPADKK